MPTATAISSAPRLDTGHFVGQKAGSHRQEDHPLGNTVLPGLCLESSKVGNWPEDEYLFLAVGVKVDLAQVEQPSAFPLRLLRSGLPVPEQWQVLGELRHMSGRSKPLPGNARWRL